MHVLLACASVCYTCSSAAVLESWLPLKNVGWCIVGAVVWAERL